MLNGRGVRGYEQTAVRRARERLDTPFNVDIVFDRRRHEFNSERGRDRLRRAQEIVVGEPLWIGDECCSGQGWRNLLEHSQPFSGDAVLVQQKARDVSPGPRQTGHDASNSRRLLSSIGDFLPYALSAPPTGPCAQSSAPPACRRTAHKSLGQT